MAKNRKEKYAEGIEGGHYAAFPHQVADSVAWMGASHVARSLLMELIRQHEARGGNNGRLHMAMSWLSKRGWPSVGQVDKAKAELIDRELIVQTKQGGLNAGASFFALTWLPITSFIGLELRPAEYHKGAWTRLNPLPPIGSKGKDFRPVVTHRNAANRHVMRRDDSSASQSSSVPATGAATPSPAPPDGTKRGVSCNVADPPDGNNEYLPLPTKKSRVPVVGRKGASGIRKEGSRPTVAFPPVA